VQISYVSQLGAGRALLKARPLIQPHLKCYNQKMEKDKQTKWSSVFNYHMPSFWAPLVILIIILVFLRTAVWNTTSFFYLLWNILLALIPFAFSTVALLQPKNGIVNKIIFVACLILWLLFIPNAPYLVTDIIHLGEIKAVPVLFDTFLLFVTASLGVIIFCLSLEQIEKIILEKFSKRKTFFIVTVIIILVSIGVYLGRFARFNSWDIFTDHQSLLGHILGVIIQTETHFVLYTLLFFSFLFSFYFSWKLFKKNN
jgi:uncharacterized membrane protein